MDMRNIINLVEGPNKYYDVIEPGPRTRFGTIDIVKPLVVYHATHKGVGLVLENRVVESYNSMGTWLSSNKEAVSELYGPNVASYHLPTGRYMLNGRKTDLFERILNCLPLIERNVDPEIAEHLLKYPYDAKNRAWMKDVRQRAQTIAAERGEDVNRGGGLQEIIHDMLYAEPGAMTRWRKLQATGNMYGKVARSVKYNQEFKDHMVRCGYKGFIWNGRGKDWDGGSHRQTIFLVLDHEPLHPIEQIEVDQDDENASFLHKMKAAIDAPQPGAAG